MQGGYGRRGGGRGRGGAYEYRGAGQPAVVGGGPSDTLCVRVSEIRQPVTEDMMHRVFSSISAAPRRLQISHSPNPNETIVMAQFPDAYVTQRVMENLNNRNIFNDGNKMVMNYAAWEPTPVLPAPHVASPAVYSTSAAAYNNNINNNINNNNNPPGMMYQQTPSIYVQPRPQATPHVPMAQLPQPNSNQIQNYQQQQQQQQLQQQQRGISGRGRGRNGRRGNNNGAAMGFDPMMMGYQQMGYASMGYPQMPMQGPGMMNNFMQQKTQNTPTVFISVTVVPETEPLQNIFTLIEAFGGVVTIRRNHSKKDILTIKMASIPEADNVVQHVRKVPFAGGTVSAKRFPTYVERTPCTDDGNPMDAATQQYDFTSARHRSPGQRSKCNPSNILKVTGCAGYSEADVMTYFTGENFFPDRIIKDDEGSFTLHMADAGTAVALLVKCHNNVCGEERSNVLFIEGAKETNNNQNAENGEENEEKK